MWSPNLFRVSEFSDRTIVVVCGDEGMETDLVFCASHNEPNHPQTQKQREIAEYIVTAVKEKSHAKSR